jgi:folate-dependent tRNA-U54 methylase TrmFO/GidA
MNINFGLFPPLGGGTLRADRKRALCERARADLDGWIAAALPRAAE